MRDNEAREQIDALQQSLTDLPQQIANIVIKHFAPRLDEVNEAVTAMQGVARQVAEMSGRIESIQETTAEQGELFNLVGEDVHSMRQELASAQKTLDAVDTIQRALDAFAQAVGRVA